MAQRSDIVLGNNKTEVVGPLDIRDEIIGVVGITDTPGGTERIRFDGVNGNVNVGGGNQKGIIRVRDPTGDTTLTAEGAANGGELLLRNSSQTPVVEVRSANDGGFVSVNDKNNNAHGDLWASNGQSILRVGAQNGGDIDIRTDDGGEMTIRDSDSDLTVELKSDNGGLINLRNKRASQVVTASATPDGGRLEINTRTGRTSCTLDGEDAALLLTGQPEQGPEDIERQRFGGGELVLRQGIDLSDLHVHARGERDSDYGVDAGNRPRIYLDGPEATLELGRKQQHQQAEAVSGQIILRDTYNTELLEANAESPTHSGSGRHASEVVFRHGDSSGTVTGAGGAIRSHGDGLMFYDARGNEALFIANTGEILTAQRINEGAL